MRFQYRINQDDLKEANIAMKSMVMGQVKLIPLLISLFILISIILLVSFLLTGSISFQTIFLMLFTVLLIYFSESVFRRFPRFIKDFSFEQRFHNSSLIGQEATVELSVEGLAINTDEVQTNSKWSVYTYWQETPNLFLIYFRDDKLYIILPKRACVTDTNIREVRELMRTKIIAD